MDAQPPVFFKLQNGAGICDAHYERCHNHTLHWELGRR